VNLPLKEKSLTLLELIIATLLTVILVLGVSSVNLFTQFHVVTADKRAQLQNEVAYILEHMTKQLARTIGNQAIDGLDKVVRIDYTQPDAASLIQVYIDQQPDGIREDPKVDPAPEEDHWLSYRFFGKTDPSSPGWLSYCSRCKDGNCNFNECLETVQVLSKKITVFTPRYDPNTNYVEVTLSACWDPQERRFACGSPDNPSVTMTTRILMPAVSVN
jgi:hypothetical protein